MKRLPKVVLLIILLIAVGSILHPFGKVKTQAAEKPLLQGAVIDPATRGILDRSCRNCHSEQTTWPWYSFVAPVSWLVEMDVQGARKHFNMSRWDGYPPEDQARILGEISAMVRNHEMPLSRYTFLHPDARLTDQDISTIVAWVRNERKRVKPAEDHENAAGAM